MTPDQTIQKLNWLDDEHRRDKAMMSQIVMQVDQHLTALNGLNKTLQDLEERIARVQGQTLRYSQIEQAVGQLRTEVGLLFEQVERRAQQREVENSQVRGKDREKIDKVSEELNSKIELVGQGQRFIGGDHEAIKRIEGGQVAFIRGIEELNKRIENLNTRVQVAEEWVKRTGALIAEVQQLADRLRQDRTDALEAMRRSDQARSRQVTEWNEQIKVSRREMDDWIAQLRPLLELPKEVRGYLTMMRELETSLKQIEPRLVQRQKLQEDYARREIENMKSELEKRESLALQEIEHMREEFSQKISAILPRFDPMEEWRPQVMEQFRDLRERMDADRIRFVNILADVVRMQVEYGRNSNARYEQFASDIITRVENERASAKVKKPPVPARPLEESY